MQSTRQIAFNQRAILLALIVFIAISSLYYTRDLTLQRPAVSVSDEKLPAVTAAAAAVAAARAVASPSRLKKPYACAAKPLLSSSGERVLITGVASMLGSRVAAYCAQTLHMRVVGIDDLSCGFESNIPASSLTTFVKGDLRDRAFVRDVFDKHGPFKVVYHLAGFSDTETSHFARLYNYEMNMVASVFLINQALNKSVDAFVFASSTGVYGPAHTTAPLETCWTSPADPVGVSKLSLEMDLIAAHDRFGLDFVVLRIHDVYGPGQHLAPHNEIAWHFRNALQGHGRFEVFGTDRERSLAYVDDVAAMVARAAIVPEARNQIINVGATQHYQASSVARAVANAMHSNVTSIDFVQRAHVRIPTVEPDFAKAKCILMPPGASETSLGTGLAAMAQWVHNHAREAQTIRGSGTVRMEVNLPDAAVALPPSPPPPTTPAPTRPPRPRIFYFGVTHSSTVHRALAVDETWGPRAMPGGLPWYSNQPEPRLKNVTVIVPPEGDSYAMIYYRMLLIWKDVWTRYPGYDWYMRLWDDNLIIVERVEQVSLAYNPEELVEIGRPRYGETTWPGGKYVPQFMGGGASALTSRAMVKKFVENIQTCPREITAQEDVTISICHTKLGVKYHRHYGFLPHCPRPAGELNVYPSDLSCRRRYREFHNEPYEHFVTFHYIKEPAHMHLFYDAIYKVPCGQAKDRAAERAEYGHGPTGMVE